MTTQPESKKRCKGCKSRRFDSYECSFMVLDLRKNCPCKECPVMVMCQQYCDSYDLERRNSTIEYMYGGITLREMHTSSSVYKQTSD